MVEEIEQSTSLALPGVQRAAVLLMTLGEQHAAEILRHLEPREVQKIGAAMASIKSVRHEQIESVLVDFCDVAKTETSIGIASHDFVRNVLVRALGREKAGSLMDRILEGDSAQGVEALRWMEARAIGQALRNEHPQVVAIVLSYLETDQAAARGSATSYLRVFALTLIACLWTQMMVVARDKDGEFYDTKRKVGRFYMAHVLPEALSLASIIETGNTTLADFDVADFGS